MSVPLSVGYRQVDVSVTDRPLVKCGMSECDRGTSQRRPGLARAAKP
jgi:hypothetical protein